MFEEVGIKLAYPRSAVWRWWRRWRGGSSVSHRVSQGANEDRSSPPQSPVGMSYTKDVPLCSTPSRPPPLPLYWEDDDGLSVTRLALKVL